jgi:ferric-dicitrate binding protein FerR (iron transport regulator)
MATPTRAKPDGAARGQISPTPSDDTHAAPYTYMPATPQPHRTIPLATRHVARPDTDARRQRIQRALSIALAAGVAAVAFWLQRRGSAARYH